MKTAGKLLGVVVLVLLCALVALRVSGLNPHDRIPGLWLTGTLATVPVTDWSFTDKIETGALQTNTWYLLPHSVTTWFTAYNGRLYLDTYNTAEQWPRNVARDPHVRLKIGNQLFDRTLVLVTDPAEREGVIQARAKKYKLPQPVPAGVSMTVYRVTPD